MAKEIRAYLITQSMFVETGDAEEDYYMPDVSSVPELVDGYTFGSDEDRWKVLTSSDHTEGVFNSYLMSIRTDTDNHTTLESEEHITRIDNMTTEQKNTSLVGFNDAIIKEDNVEEVISKLMDI